MTCRTHSGCTEGYLNWMIAGLAGFGMIPVQQAVKVEVEAEKKKAAFAAGSHSRAIRLAQAGAEVFLHVSSAAPSGYSRWVAGVGSHSYADLPACLAGHVAPEL